MDFKMGGPNDTTLETRRERLAEDMAEHGIIPSGQAKTLGIGAMTDEHWGEISIAMSDLGAFDTSLDDQQAYTLPVIHRGSTPHQG